MTPQVERPLQAQEVCGLVRRMCAETNRTARARGLYAGSPQPAEVFLLVNRCMGKVAGEIKRARSLRDIRFTGTGKPTGVPSWIAEVVITLCSWCEQNGIDLGSAIAERMRYNATRVSQRG